MYNSVEMVEYILSIWQVFSVSKGLEIRKEDNCFDVGKRNETVPVKLFDCHGDGGNQVWDFKPVSYRCPSVFSFFIFKTSHGNQVKLTNTDNTFTLIFVYRRIKCFHSYLSFIQYIVVLFAEWHSGSQINWQVSRYHVDCFWWWPRGKAMHRSFNTAVAFRESISPVPTDT